MGENNRSAVPRVVSVAPRSLQFLPLEKRNFGRWKFFNCNKLDIQLPPIWKSPMKRFPLFCFPPFFAQKITVEWTWWRTQAQPKYKFCAETSRLVVFWSGKKHQASREFASSPLTRSARFMQKWDRLPGMQVVCGPSNQKSKLINEGRPKITKDPRAMKLKRKITKGRSRDRDKTPNARASETTTEGAHRRDRRHPLQRESACRFHTTKRFLAEGKTK